MSWNTHGLTRARTVAAGTFFGTGVFFVAAYVIVQAAKVYIVTVMDPLASTGEAVTVFGECLLIILFVISGAAFVLCAIADYIIQGCKN